MELFDYLNQINVDKQDIMNPEKFPETYQQNRKEYNAYLVNMLLGRNKDCVFYVNEMNMCNSIPGWMQYDFYRCIIPKKKRYAKKIEIDKEQDLDIICEFYNCNKSIAKSYLKTMKKETIQGIKEFLNKGGKK